LRRFAKAGGCASERPRRDGSAPKAKERPEAWDFTAETLALEKKKFMLSHG
jgi:hypothetical protein